MTPSKERINELVTEITDDLSGRYNDLNRQDKINNKITYIIRKLAIEIANNEILKEQLCQTNKK